MSHYKSSANRAPSTQALITETETASRILQALNKDVDPCTDFYEFACGGWIKENPVPDWDTRRNQLGKLSEQRDKDLRELLEAKDDEGLPNSVLNAKSFYKACINTEKLEADGIKPIQKLLQQLGLPPNPPSEVSANLTWEEVAGRGRRQLGLNVLLEVGVDEDIRDTSRNLVYVDQVSPVSPVFSWFSDRYLLQPEQFSHELQQYHKYIRSMISIAHNETDAEQFADDIVDFSKKLAKIMTPVEVRGRNYTISFWSVQTLLQGSNEGPAQWKQIMTPVEVRGRNHTIYFWSVQKLLQGSNEGPAQWKQHDWGRYLNLVFSNTSVTLQLHQDQVLVVDRHYLQKLSVLLSDTKPVIIERFLWWSVFTEVAPMTLSAFRSLKFEFSRAVVGQQQRTPRWKRCTNDVNANFGVALGYLYVKRHFDNTTRQKATEMVEDVRSAFAANVQGLDWMDSTTRQNTLNKLKAMRNNVGYPDWLLTHEQLDKHYKHVEVVEGSFFETYLKLKFADVKKSLECLREKPDKNQWGDTVTTVNAFYSTQLNSVTVPAGILRPPFYGNGIEAINYGSIGAIMGHEVTHGFDDKGRQYDEEGILKQWWSEATLNNYNSKVQCIIDQYSKYHMPQLSNYTVNGFNTQGENIADNGGLRAALHAYQLFAKRAPADRRVSLPGLPDYKPDQLFFLGFAQTWCSNSTVGALKLDLLDDVHSPNKIRVIGTLSNSAEFAEAWSCPAGTPMNPVHKCVLW